MRQLKDQPVNVLAGAIVLLGAVLRVFHLGHHDLWLDEALSYHFVTSRTLPELLFSVPLVDPHPPLYYAILDIWTGIAGTSEIALRFPSAVFGTAAVGAFYILVKGVFNKTVGSIAALLMAVSPFYIRYSQEARNYALGVLLVILSTLFLHRAIKHKTRQDYSGYVITAVLLGYTHVWGLFVLAAHAIYVFSALAFFHPKRRTVSWRPWLVEYVAIGLLLSPWVSVLIWRTLFSVSDTALGSIAPPSVAMLLLMPAEWMTGDKFHHALGLLVPAAIIAGGAWFGHAAVRLYGDHVEYWLGNVLPLRERSEDTFDSSGLLFAALLIVPIAIGITISYLVRPIYYTRSTIFAAVGFYAFLAKGTNMARELRGGQVVAIVLVLGLVLPLPGYYNEDSVEPWGEVTDPIQQRSDGDDLILITDQYMQVPFEYYAADSEATIRTVAENPNRNIGIRPLYPSTIPTEIREMAATYDTVWLVLSHTTKRHNNRIIKQVNATHQVVKTNEVPGVRILKFSG
ncbi:glycosyltransferase family 39 protein [Halococcus dombrowskii]|uniref:Glycosyltransferase family 39 protein n=1 Tax=Halococcus dombrowskii TaxID=179637 RepID=A0AAX3AL38_HALDO|nr:glycosyltransferase family 39 protein [Halococcus dombrowskii]UOO94769.1 glycosyltransferase family 39 protein [Halococcus dombrowskii]